MEDQEVITTGVYRFVRHPIYAGLWLWACAQLLLIHNWVEGFAFLVLYVPLYLIRVPREEAMMVQQFGDEYRRYLESTPALIPRPWRAYGTMEVEDSTPSTIEGPAEGDAEHSERVDAGEEVGGRPGQSGGVARGAGWAEGSGLTREDVHAPP
ncbi:MAG: DUF1295 domain-containing protein [Anaerolineae bacterium]|nr:DUF1295 domain-containing protein [Anaerolineae bacterium]